MTSGYALAIHAAPRFTKELDVWVNPTAESAPRVLAALKEFGAPLDELTQSDLATPGIVFVANKRASGRPQDLVDADAIEQVGGPTSR